MTEAEIGVYRQKESTESYPQGEETVLITERKVRGMYRTCWRRKKLSRLSGNLAKSGEGRS